ncbi:MAG: polyprenyl synthetase family protein [Candidatus Obscuribacterales bacterium]|nr:polyprenyl synthetase family protein [Candidatus Obscuribacterales bacterium]
MASTTTSQSAFDFKSYMADRRELVDHDLEKRLSCEEPSVLWESMRYSALASGKRIRALLAIAAYETVSRLNNRFDISHSAHELSLSLKPVMPLSCAIEMVHAMSLIHDDLPCLDNDDMRRGKPTNHKVYGEAMALLAGDALLMRAFEVLLGSGDMDGDIENSAILLDIASGLATATGANGMVGGQVFDLIYTGLGADKGTIDETIIRKIHKGKTGALLRFSLWSGARLARAETSQLEAMERFGDIMGLGFQIADDLLDVTGNIETLGKTPGKDQAANKATWVSVFGIDTARENLLKLESEGKLLLETTGLSQPDQPALESLLEMAIHRNK